MAQYPVLPIWTDRYLADTRHLTTEQHGAYFLLLMEAWRRPTCSLPDNDDVLARLVCTSIQQWRAIKPTVMAFWKLNKKRGEWSNKKLSRERERTAEKSAKQSKRASSRWNKKKNGSAVAVPGESRSDAENMPPLSLSLEGKIEAKASLSETSSDARPKSKGKTGYTAEFEAFWQAYPRTPNMSKPKTFAAWAKLSAADRRASAAAIEPYRAFLDAKEGHPTMHATTFINERRFDGFLEQATASAPKPITDEDWQKRLGHGRNKALWHVERWGPMPGDPDCRVPEHLIQPGDGQGWAVWDA